MAMGRIADRSQARQLVRKSFDPKTYEPGPGGGWNDAAGKLQEIMRSSG